MTKSLIAMILLSSIVFAADSPMYSPWKFQTPDQAYVLQMQYEYWNRAKAGNPQGYDYQTQVNQFYVNGGFNVETMNGSYQTVTNIGNINEINGDGNTVHQTSRGDQSGSNTVSGGENESLN